MNWSELETLVESLKNNPLITILLVIGVIVIFIASTYLKSYLSEKAKSHANKNGESDSKCNLDKEIITNSGSENGPACDKEVNHLYSIEVNEDGTWTGGEDTLRSVLVKLIETRHDPEVKVALHHNYIIGKLNRLKELTDRKSLTKSEADELQAIKGADYSLRQLKTEWAINILFLKIKDFRDDPLGGFSYEIERIISYVSEVLAYNGLPSIYSNENKVNETVLFYPPIKQLGCSIYLSDDELINVKQKWDNELGDKLLSATYVIEETGKEVPNWNILVPDSYKDLISVWALDDQFIEGRLLPRIVITACERLEAPYPLTPEEIKKAFLVNFRDEDKVKNILNSHSWVLSTREKSLKELFYLQSPPDARSDLLNEFRKGAESYANFKLR